MTVVLLADLRDFSRMVIVVILQASNAYEVHFAECYVMAGNIVSLSNEIRLPFSLLRLHYLHLRQY